MKTSYRKVTVNEAEEIAIGAFSFITGDGERLSRFLAVSGLRPDTIRSAASAPGFFAAILDYVAADEPLLIELAKELNTNPERIMEAHRTLSPSEFE